MLAISEKVSLAPYAWWKIGGEADYFCEPTTVEEVIEAAQFARDRGLSLTILSGGTNVLISDTGVEGLVLSTRRLKGVTSREENQRLVIECMAGTPKAELTKLFLMRRLAPALMMCGLPGNIDGGVVMNAGVSESIEPREFVELTDWVEFVDLRDLTVRRLSRAELQWHYRGSVGWQPGIVVRAGFSWPMVEVPDIQSRVKEATRVRLSKQPLDLPSCGSVFKNPGGGVSAGSLIDQCGLKGYTIGGAQISMKHANFIVNIGGARAEDVQQIIYRAKRAVFEKFGVKLETEVRFLGRW